MLTQKKMYKMIGEFPKVFFNFSYKCMVVKILFQDQIFEIEILMDLHVLRSPESENNISRGWSMRVCLYICLYVFVDFISTAAR